MAILAPSQDNIQLAAQNLRNGDVVALPTETVYGLAADATNPAAVEKVFALKGRPAINPLICHVPDEAGARALGLWTPLAAKLAASFWPGPLTLVLKRAPTCEAVEAVSAGLPTIAIRRPSHEVMEAVLAETGKPLAAPSANPSGRLSPTRAEHVAAALEIPVLDGGPCQAGLESTVVDATGPTPVVLRKGSITLEALKQVTGSAIEAGGAPELPTSPGQLLQHYAPNKPLRLNVEVAEPDEIFIGFGTIEKTDLNLSPTGDLKEAAAALFALLHQADHLPGSAIAVAPIPKTGLGVAINDRLHRAAQRPT